MLSEMLIQKMILLLDEISVLQSRKLRNQVLDILNLTETMLITCQHSRSVVKRLATGMVAAGARLVEQLRWQCVGSNPTTGTRVTGKTAPSLGKH